jgi:hypothetical protein
MKIQPKPLTSQEREAVRAWLRQPESILFRKVIHSIAEQEDEDALKELHGDNTDRKESADEHAEMARRYRMFLHVMDEALNSQEFPFATNEIISDCQTVILQFSDENTN